MSARRLGLLLAAPAFGLLALATLVTGCSGATKIPDPQIPQETRETSVFFSTGRTLVEELRIVDATDVYRATLMELLAARPTLNSEIAIVQPVATVNSVTVKDGVATIDWSPDVLSFEADDKEKVLALGAILTTMGQFPEVEKVRFTVEGKTEGTVGNKDIQSFWGAIGLKGQPWKVIRPPEPSNGSIDTTSTAGFSHPTTSTTNK